MDLVEIKPKEKARFCAEKRAFRKPKNNLDLL